MRKSTLVTKKSKSKEGIRELAMKCSDLEAQLQMMNAQNRSKSRLSPM